VVFGSVARKTGRPDSDLDIGVRGIESPARLASLAVTLSRVAGREVDLIRLDTAPPLLRFEIARDGVVLLQREPDLWPDFRARAMVDWWDWAPLARRFAKAAGTRLRWQTTHGPS
jgi:predicted nucleotidyltransferase